MEPALGEYWKPESKLFLFPEKEYYKKGIGS